MAAQFTLLSRTAVLGLLAAVAIGCGGDRISPGPNPGRSAAVSWNQRMLEGIVSNRTNPPAGSRIMAITSTAMYDAWAAYDPDADGVMFGEGLRRPDAEHTDANKAKAVSFAAYRVLTHYFPDQADRYEQFMVQMGYDPANTTTDTSTPEGIGNVVAQAILDDRRTDGSNEANGYADTTGYTPVNTATTLNDPGRWQPQPGQSFLLPHWGTVRPFAITNLAALRPNPPQVLNTPGYDAQAEEIRSISAGLTDRQKMIAEYWAGGPGTVTPPGYWQQIAQEVSASRGQTLDEDVQMFFILGNAVMDAAICCWEAKVFYDYCRPITAVRHVFNGQQIQAWGGPSLGTQTIAGETWRPYIATPPFAEYTSGHSTFSAASAQALRLFTGSDALGLSVTLAPGSSSVEPGVTPAQTVVLSWGTFTEAAQEAGISRVYGGIHFSDGNLNGQAAGTSIGQQVYDRAMEYISGSAIP